MLDVYKRQDLGYRTVTAEGWEADDILGTLAAACAARKDDCFLATGDRASLQLVSDTTTCLLYTSQGRNVGRRSAAAAAQNAHTLGLSLIHISPPQTSRPRRVLA